MLQLNKKGFTLIELLVVIAIIGVLGSIVFAPFNEARKKGRDGKRIAELKGLQSSLLLFSEDASGCFPDAAISGTGSSTPQSLNASNYKYISQTLFAKMISQNAAASTTAWTAVQPYGLRSVGDSSQCIRTSGSINFFPYYQLFVELETRSSGLDGDADSNMSPSNFSNGTGVRTGASSQSYDGLNLSGSESCSNYQTGSWQCVFDLSNL